MSGQALNASNGAPSGHASRDSGSAPSGRKMTSDQSGPSNQASADNLSPNIVKTPVTPETADDKDDSDAENPHNGNNGEASALMEENGTSAGDLTHEILNADGMTIQTRFREPEGFRRLPVASDSFAQYLRDLPLKEDGEPVLYYNGAEKRDGVYSAVVDQPISDRDLHQCADAIMRLRAQYLYARGRYDEIAFHFVNGFLCDYEHWRAGSRVKFQNNAPYWTQSAGADSGEEKFQAYLEVVYAYASTLSLEKELKSVDIADMQIGDVFIKGGSPGHAIIVVDMAENERGERCFMTAQSYMPAQQTHVLRNLNDSDISPWYPLDFGETLDTPQWTFSRSQLKRFP